MKGKLDDSFDHPSQRCIVTDKLQVPKFDFLDMAAECIHMSYFAYDLLLVLSAI